jgi:hypothetical protein
MRSVLAVLACVFTAVTPSAQTPRPYEPEVGQAGKDVVWVPTPPDLVKTMLDIAEVTSADLVVDLGSGDGRNIIAAAKRGARGRGVEFNPDMVALSRSIAEREGVANLATFVQGDMFTADFSDATVLALFLLPANMDKLQPKFFDMKPGTRIVANTFGITGWEADRVERTCEEYESWCTALLWIVPAKVQGTWRASFGELRLEQKFQVLSGSLIANGSTTPLQSGRLRGDRISFVVGNAQYSGRVNGERIDGTTSAGGAWSATRVRSTAAVSAPRLQPVYRD